MTATPPGRTTRGLRGALRRARRTGPSLGTVGLGGPHAIAIGALIGLVAIALKVGINMLLGGDSGFILLTAAVVGAAWVGGLGAGIAATVITAIANPLLFVLPETAPDGTLTLVATPIDLARLGLFLLGGLIVSLLVASLRTSRDQLAASVAEIAGLAADIERRDERLELVLAASDTGFWEWDVRGGGLVWSQAIFEQHGLDPAAGPPTYERYVETIHPDDRETFERSIASALATGESFSHEFRIAWPDGSVHWTHGVGRVFRGADGTPLRMVGTGQDVTERRRLEEERDRLLEEERRAGTFREAFVDVISHELRTPITTILGLTQILARRGRPSSAEDSAALIDDIADESERLHRLVEDLLVLTKAERGAIAVDAEPLELRRLLTRIAEHEADRLPSIVIRTELAPDLPVVNGEATFVEQIVRNLLGNAAKYTPAGTPVTVAASVEGDAVAIRVLDAGPGLSEASAEHVFELFYRDPVQARTVAGSGIGLYVCASLVEAMGGTIWARPRPEGGSEFGFTLRVIPDDEASVPDRAEPVSV